MKKIVPLIAASALMICTLPSCSASKDSIIGKWEMTSLENTDIKVGGLEFNENGKGSMYMDTSSILRANGKKIKVGDEETGFEFDEQYIEYDKKNLKIEINGQDMLTLERASGEGSDDNYNGEYKLKSGVLYDTVVNGITSNIGDEADVNVYITFDEAVSEVKYVDIFDYTAKNGKLEISGYASFIGENADGKPVVADYTIEGDKLSVTSDQGNTEELIRVE